MWVKQLMDEFYNWLWYRKAYTTCGQIQNFFKFILFTLLSVIIFVLISFAGSEGLTNQGVWLLKSLRIIVAIDICFFFIRFTHLCSSLRELNFIIFLHCLIHLTILANVLLELVLTTNLTFEEAMSKKDTIIFKIVYIIAIIRCFYYAALVIFYILCSPCIIQNILEKRRQREDLLLAIRRSRNNSLFLQEGQVIGLPLLVDNRRGQPIPERIPEEEFLPYDPVPQNNNAPRASFHNRLLNIMGQEDIEPIERNTLDLLKRVKYFTDRDNLAGVECSICLQPLSDFQDEQLIYLPCSRKHIFHSNCIIDWLKRDRNCPLCRVGVNSDLLKYSGY
ncbi:unnamed protein product [Moneuplotes crassus]|uniref:RING-type domain-containing protein n=1 Tax=Euplotes crassus TaxID=5936 RepID=A0AAD1XN49_EUPCR|nr:unnamed protein product [Moneuplotes crassus]